MASARRQRDLERQRQLRQAQRRRELARRRRQRTLLASGVGAVVLIVGLALFLGLRGGGTTAASPAARATGTPTPSPSAAPASSAAALPLACGLTAAPAAPARQTFPAAPPLTIDKAATYTMSIQTSCGTVTAALDAAKAPTTVNSFAFLAGKGYFDRTECHRATTSPGLTVLQCGDPTGTGSGSPGYTFPDENLTGATYKRGTLAMANSGPGTNGSQFFLVDKDSQLPPSYTPFGTITGGLDVLDAILAKGVAGGGTDGKPAQRVFLTHLTVTRA